mmetsp:Transcript_19940/g.76388  ORF Transcript_19940/g.76388 Transcript_19940/m.76388 type:complete len:212 (-) Transcript_19940:1028-1663(-)
MATCTSISASPGAETDAFVTAEARWLSSSVPLSFSFSLSSSVPVLLRRRGTGTAASRALPAVHPAPLLSGREIGVIVLLLAPLKVPIDDGGAVGEPPECSNNCVRRWLLLVIIACVFRNAATAIGSSSSASSSFAAAAAPVSAGAALAPRCRANSRAMRVSSRRFCHLAAPSAPSACSCTSNSPVPASCSSTACSSEREAATRHLARRTRA